MRIRRTHVKLVDAQSEYTARLYGLELDCGDTLRCGHPHGVSSCTRLIACGECPFAEVLELDSQNAA